jgi:nitronate monooxygenase
MRTRHPGGTIASMTRFTELVGCRLPIQLAPMGTVGCSVELQLEVARAGAHPVYPGVDVPAPRLAAALDAIGEEATAFGVNFIVPLLDPEALAVAVERAPFVDFFHGDPDPALVARVHAGGALASWQVGSPAEALAAAEAGCDVLVAQGDEAGGRIRGSQPRMELLAQVVRAVDVPVLAAGGIRNAGDVADAIAAGAAGVRVGTRFVAAREANAHPAYQQALVDAGPDESVVTRVFAAGVADLPHRVLRRSLVGAQLLDAEVVGQMSLGDGAERLPRYTSLAPGRDFTGAVEAMPFYAGRSVEGVRRIAPAAEIVSELAENLARAGAPSGT